MELSIPYELIGPDGTRAVLGNGQAATSDPDWCGYLDPDNGITGLLDGAAIRESASDLVEEDGGAHGPFYLSRRAGTVQGILPPFVLGAARDVYWQKLKRATRALRADGTLRWTPSTDSIQRQVLFRRQATPTSSGRSPRTFQLGLVSADPFVYSSSEASVVITPGASAGELGIVDPITDPITSPLNVTAQQFVINQGDAETWPRFRIDGPITNPIVLNYTTGEQVALIYTLGAGEWLDVYPRYGRILLGGTSDRSGALDFPNSGWWKLEDGTNDVRLLAAAYSAGAQLTVYWRHAWE